MIVLFHPRFLSTVEYYNPDSGTWGHVASLIDPTIGVAAIGFKNYVYVIGGFLEMDDESIVLGSVECFDPQRNRQVFQLSCQWYCCSSTKSL